MATGNTDDGMVGEKLLSPMVIILKVSIDMISNTVKESMNPMTVMCMKASSKLINTMARGTLAGPVGPTTRETSKMVSDMGMVSTPFPIMVVIMRDIG